MTIKIRKGMHRTDDHATSVAGAKSVTYRAGSQKHRLLLAYAQAFASGLTDEEAAVVTGLTESCYWKRCGELRQDGFIQETDRTRKGTAGVPRMVSTITPEGLRAAKR